MYKLCLYILYRANNIFQVPYYLFILLVPSPRYLLLPQTIQQKHVMLQILQNMLLQKVINDLI